MADRTLLARSSLAGLPTAVGDGHGVVVCDRDGIGIATLLSRRDGSTALTEGLRIRFGLELPIGPTRVTGGGVAFAGVGRGAWIATAERGANGFAGSLKEVVGDLGAVVDQSDGYIMLRLTGKNVRQALAKGFFIDLHPRAFRTGDVATTTVSHIGATIWRLADSPEGQGVFEITIFRSLAHSFWHWLCESSAEFGLAMDEHERG